jgi:catechol 2,3-dioxygenase-like lactoylglutathione lyase family enzyme
MITGIDHIEVIVPDLAAYIAFFKRLGFEVVLETSHHGGSAELRLPGMAKPILELHQVSAEENPGINHIAFGCDDIQATRQQLIDRGVPFETNPPDFGEAVLFAQTGRWVANFRDPGGWRWQLVATQRVPPTE